VRDIWKSLLESLPKNKECQSCKKALQDFTEKEILPSSFVQVQIVRELENLLAPVFTSQEVTHQPSKVVKITEEERKDEVPAEVHQEGRKRKGRMSRRKRKKAQVQA
jgi:hypothetical protein